MTRLLINLNIKRNGNIKFKIVIMIYFILFHLIFLNSKKSDYIKDNILNRKILI